MVSWPHFSKAGEMVVGIGKLREDVAFILILIRVECWRDSYIPFSGTGIYIVEGGWMCNCVEVLNSRDRLFRVCQRQARSVVGGRYSMSQPTCRESLLNCETMWYDSSIMEWYISWKLWRTTNGKTGISSFVVAVKFIYSNFSSMDSSKGSRDVRMRLSRLWKRRYLRATHGNQRENGRIEVLVSDWDDVYMYICMYICMSAGICECEYVWAIKQKDYELTNQRLDNQTMSVHQQYD